ncbi:MAG: PP2C family serine/threonine-protein phosphatase [Gemmatimonadota bacterium]
MNILGFRDRPVRISLFAKTDVGRIRDHNEDCYLVVDLSPPDPSLTPKVREHTLREKGSILVVADGMGGATAGEVASQMATKVIFDRMVSTWVKDRRTDLRAFSSFLEEAIQGANQEIHQRSLAEPTLHGMGTTLTAVGVLGRDLTFAQVGDSRGYLIRNGQVEQVTKDQSLTRRLIDEGQLTEADAEMSPGKNIILQALGPSPTLDVVLTHRKAFRGDTLVLCSDGLSGVVTEEEIRDTVGRCHDPAVACEDLVELANSRGGPDNITVIVARLDGPGLKEPRGGR